MSNQNYARFCSETHRDPPPGPAPPDLPVVNITIADAHAYAKWAGKRLPTAQEWEQAARGKKNSAYPWGDEKDPRRANVKDNPDLPPHKLQPVDALPKSATPYGALNLVGNAWELVDGSFAADAQTVQTFAGLQPPATATEPWTIIRGGSFTTPLQPGLTSDFQAIPERYKSDDISFRCVKNVN